jgi:hypothetical protein
MRSLLIVFRDFVGLCRIAGIWVGLRWLAGIAITVPEILGRGNLSSADCNIGKQHFSIRLGRGVRLQIAGRDALSGTREMYVRGVYLGHGLLRIEDGDKIMDLGANMGNFTAMALAHGPNVKVVAVEPSTTMNQAFRDSVGLNPGFLQRTKLVRAVLGATSDTHKAITSSDAYSGAPWIAEDDRIAQAGFASIDNP